MSNEHTIIVENADEVINDMRNAEEETIEATEEEIKEFTEQLFLRIVQTSPFDSGKYQSEWDYEEIEGDEIGYVITNDAEHAKYLVFPNSKMVGAMGADDPGQGILHNVRGIVHQKRRDYTDNIETTLQRLYKGN